MTDIDDLLHPCRNKIHLIRRYRQLYILRHHIIPKSRFHRKYIRPVRNELKLIHT